MLLKSSEVCKLTGQSKDQLWRWRDKNIGPPYIKINERVILYPLPSFYQWVVSNCVGDVSAILERARKLGIDLDDDA